jgi:transmembrane sensor
MRIPDANDDGFGEVERVAAEWVLRQSRGLSADEINALAQWLASDARHERIYREMETTSRMLDGLKFRVTHEARQPPKATSSSVLRRQWFRAAVGIAAVLILGVIVLQFTQRESFRYADAASTAIGESKRLELPDGSTILLNTNTAVEVSYARDERRVRLLSGQAYFQVARDRERPFVVQAGRVAVQAVGTAFDVRLRADALSVLVAEGKVSVSNVEPRAPAAVSRAAEPGPVLSVGHMVRVPLNSDQAPTPDGMVVTVVEPRAIRSALAWHQGRMEFFDTPLAEVVAEFNRYNRHQIVIADPELAARRFGGAFDSHQIAPFLELLEQSFGVVAEPHASETVIRQVR